MNTIDPTQLQTIKELALYIVGLSDHKDWSDAIVLDYILDACYKIIGTKTQKIGE